MLPAPPTRDYCGLAELRLSSGILGFPADAPLLVAETREEQDEYEYLRRKVQTRGPEGPA